MSINHIISYFPQFAIHQANKFVKILSSIDKKIYFFATTVGGLSVLLISREIKFRKIEKNIAELTKLNNVLSTKYIDTKSSLSEKEKNIEEIKKENLSLKEKYEILIQKFNNLESKIDKLLINNFEKKLFFNNIQRINNELKNAMSNQINVLNRINIQFNALNQKQDKRYKKVLENMTKLIESHTQWSRTINDQIHDQVIKAGVMLERAGSSSKAYLSRAWSWFGEATEGMSLNL